jgi:hypothetical protein
MDHNVAHYFAYDNGEIGSLYASICLLRLLNHLSRNLSSDDQRGRPQPPALNIVTAVPGHEGIPSNGYMSPTFDHSIRSQKHVMSVSTHLLYDWLPDVY